MLLLLLLLHCTALRCAALHCAALHCAALHCTAPHCTVQCTALQYLASISSVSTQYLHGLVLRAGTCGRTVRGDGTLSRAPSCAGGWESSVFHARFLGPLPATSHPQLAVSVLLVAGQLGPQGARGWGWHVPASGAGPSGTYPITDALEQSRLA